MDATVIDQHLENIDRRLTRLEQILPSLATKQEFEPLATKEDLKTLATKEELKTLATKEELKTLATKEDLKTLATKEELKMLATKEELKNLATKQELRAEHDRLRLDMRILLEHQDGKLQMIAEHVLSLMPKAPTEPDPR
jgi:hypothetical protein